MKNHQSLLGRFISTITYKKQQKSHSSKSLSGHAYERKNTDENLAIFRDLKCNIDFINQSFNAPSNKDIVIRKLSINANINNNIDAFIVYIEGMADRTTINNFILRPLLNKENFIEII
jgi:spore germination protein KA